MRKGSLLLAILMIASAPTLASAAKKKAAPAAPAKFDTTPQNSNDNTMRLFRDGLGKAMMPAAAPAPTPAAPPKMKKAKAKKAEKKKA